MVIRRHPGIQQAAMIPTHSVGGTIAPTLRYRDVEAAIDWLCGAFGFEKRRVLSAPNGAVHYAELGFGDGTIMLGPVQEADKLMTQPADIGGTETQICYLFVEDAGIHCARAKDAGAEIVLDLEEDGGGRGYSCRDLEGHVWNFGTYDPRHGQSLTRPGTNPKAILRPRVRTFVLCVGLLVNAMTGIGLLGLTYLASEHALSTAHANASSQRAAISRQPVSPIKDVDDELTSERKARTAAERDALEARERFAQERSAREAADRTAKDANDRLATAFGERADLELVIAELRKTISSHDASPPRSAPPNAPQEGGIRIERFPNKYLNLDGYTKHPARNYPECEHLCLAEAKCLGVEFNRKNRTCELFDQLNPFVADVDADAGIKRSH